MRFPKAKFADTNNVGSQIAHIISECDEVREASAIRSRQDLIDEINDLAHSIETLCHIIPEEMEASRLRVIEKNERRGYYGVASLAGHVMKQSEQPGGSTPSQYSLPHGAAELQDLIEHRGMNFAVGNIFKACYRLGNCDHSDELRDVRKILWFAQREVNRRSK